MVPAKIPDAHSGKSEQIQGIKSIEFKPFGFKLLKFYLCSDLVVEHNNVKLKICPVGGPDNYRGVDASVSMPKIIGTIAIFLYHFPDSYQ